MEPSTAAVSDVFLGWLNAEFGRAYEPVEESGILLARDGERTVEFAVSALYPLDADPSWSRRCQAVEKQLRETTSVPLTLWIPPDADLPHGDRTAFLRRIAEAVQRLQPGERGQVEFPVSLTLRKTSSDASYVHMLGGLAPHWAKLTGRAYGQYVLDATPIHRLPEPESRVADLLDWVALLGNGMKPGTSSDFEAEDTWTIRRPRYADAVTLLGAPPGSDPTNGTGVRRQLRDTLRRAAGRTSIPYASKALVFAGIFRTMEEENATIALRGGDPSLYGGFDVICLVADGRCKPLLSPRRDRL